MHPQDLFFPYICWGLVAVCIFNLSSCVECSDCGREKARLTACCVHLKFPAPNLTVKQVFAYVFAQALFYFLHSDNPFP